MSRHLAGLTIDALQGAISAVSPELLVTQPLGAGTADRAVLSTSELTIVATTAPAVAKIPFKTLFAPGHRSGRVDLMYWDVDGDLLRRAGRMLRPGRYVVRADLRSRSARLMSLPARRNVGDGDLCFCCGKQPTVMQKIADVGLDSVSFDNKKHTAKVCGHVTVEGPLGAHVTITACITVQL
jgi:hypothetical protein